MEDKVLNKQRRFISILLMLSMVLSMTMVTGCTSKYVSPRHDSKSLVVTIGKDKIYMDTLKPYIADTEITTEYYNQMYKQYNAEYDIWSEKAADGVVNAVSLRNEVLKNFEEMYISNKEAAKDDKYKIPNKDLKKLEDNSKKLVKTFSKKMIKKTGFKSDSFVEMQKMKYVYDKYKADVIKSFKVTKADVKDNYDYKNIYRQYKTTNLYISTVETDDSGNEKAMSDAEKKKAKETMEKALKMLKEGKSVKEITKKYPSITSEEKSYQQDEAYPDKVPGTDDSKKNDSKKDTSAETDKDEYVEATKKLKNGKFTDVFEYDKKYTIGIMDNNDSKEAYDSAIEQGISEKEEKMFTDKIDKLKKTKEYKVKVNKKVWNSLKLGNLTIIPEEFSKATGNLKDKTAE